MHTVTSRRLIPFFLAVLLLTACGDSDQGDDQQPTLTFDGTTAAYSGPSELEAYPTLQTFRLVNNSDQIIDFVFAPVKPEEFEGITEQDAIEWELTESSPPPWIGNPGHFAKNVPSGEALEGEATFIADKTYQLAVWSVSAEKAYFAAWIDAVPADD
jgi:hypothetical protein